MIMASRTALKTVKDHNAKESGSLLYDSLKLHLTLPTP